MPMSERKAIVEALGVVDQVIDFDDTDNTANHAIYKVGSMYPGDKVIFANGGDRNDTTTPEYKLYSNYPWVQFEFGIGGENKKNSSSWILDEWKTQRTHRTWGYWRVLDDKQPEGWAESKRTCYQSTKEFIESKAHVQK